MKLKANNDSTAGGCRHCAQAGAGLVARSGGFTLIEMVGVLTVIMILAVVILGTTLRQMEQVVGNEESACLQRYADALRQSILRNHAIPGTTNWAAAIATEAGESVVTVSTNARGRQRILLVHPQIEIGVDNGGLPYTQGITGSVVTSGSDVVAPVNPRLMLLSSLGPPLPSTLASGVNISQWQNLWDTPEGTVPTGGSPWNTWGGTGNDLRIQRIDLGSLFVHLLLNNYGSPGLGRYSIDGLATNTVPTGAVGVDAYFLQGTVLGLFTDTGVMDSQQVLAEDSTYVYYLGTWQSSITEPQVTPTTMEYMANRFYTSPWNTRATGAPDTQTTVLNAMETFMNAYRTWSTVSGFPKSTNSAYVAVVNAQSALTRATSNLMSGPVEGGCP